MSATPFIERPDRKTLHELLKLSYTSVLENEVWMLVRPVTSRLVASRRVPSRRVPSRPVPSVLFLSRGSCQRSGQFTRSKCLNDRVCIWKLEVVQKEVAGYLTRLARIAASITLNDKSWITQSVTRVGVELLGLSWLKIDKCLRNSWK